MNCRSLHTHQGYCSPKDSLMLFEANRSLSPTFPNLPFLSFTSSKITYEIPAPMDYIVMIIKIGPIITMNAKLPMPLRLCLEPVFEIFCEDRDGSF